MPLRVVANAPWLSLARAALARPDFIRPASLAHRHTFPRPSLPAHTANSVDADYFTPPENPSSILEHSVSEYNVVANEFEAVTAQNADEQLQKLVKARDWQSASRLRAHILDSSFPIHASSIYAEAALQAAKRVAPEQQIDEFAAWLTLIPDAQDARSHNFEHLINELTAHPSLIGPSGLILTTKGYLDVVRSRIVPLLATHAEPSLREHFLRLYEQEGAVFMQRKLLHPAQGTISHKQPKIDHMLEDLAEYAAVHADVDTMHTTEHLEHLVADGQYHAALLLRQEFEEWNVIIPPSPVYASAATQAITKLLDLAALKEDTHVDDDLVSAAFSSWFSLVPDASKNTDGMKWLDDTRHSLLTMPRTNVPVIRQFGLMCAERGYARAVLRHIIPHVIQLSSPEDSYQFLEQTMSFARAWDKSNCETDNGFVVQIMALSMRSYALGGYLDFAVKVLTQCDQNNLKFNMSTYDFLLRQLQTRPKRAAELAPQIREMKERWYPKGILTAISTRDSPAPDHELARLVDAGRFEQASELLRTWTGPPIPRDHWYSYPAELALQHPNADERLELFKAWFDLIPNASPSIVRYFGGIRSHLLPIAQGTQLPIAFALGCMRKGYFNAVLNNVVPGIIKKGFPLTTARFLDDLVLASKEATANYPPLEAGAQLMRVLNVCVRTFCEDRRPAEAVAFLRSQGQHGVKPGCETLDMLTGILRDYHYAHPDHADIAYVRQLRAVSTRPITNSSNLVAELRYWREISASKSKPQSIPNYNAIAAFMKSYTDLGRTKAITLLRNRALRHQSIPLGSAWTFGEMLFHLRKGNYEMVIAVFASHFTLVGVPRLSILDFMQQWEQQNGPLNATSLRVRALPNSRHVSLVWHAMINLAKGRKDLSALYNHFRQEVRLSQSSPRDLRMFRENLVGDTKEAPRPPPALLFEGRIFSDFISAFNRSYSARYGVRVVLDMVRMRLAPSAEQLSLVAGAYAAQGEVYPAISLLKLMMQSEPHGQEQALPDAIKADPVELLKASLLASNFSIPPPDLTSYLRVIRGFLSSNRLDAACQVRRLMESQVWYKAGANSELERVIGVLEARLAERGGKVSEKMAG